MRDLSRYLLIAGAVVFIVLGLAHAALTPQTTGEAKGLSPRDPATREAMARDTLLLTHRTSLWLAWVGFNLSHSLGLVIFGVVTVLIGRSSASFEGQARLFLPLAVLVCLSYVALGLLYWFRTPLAGILLAGLCFLASWVFFVRAG